MTKKQIFTIIGGAIAIIVVLIIFGLKNEPAKIPASLEVWGVYDELDVLKPFIDAYQEQNNHIKIEYRKFSFENYEKELINAFAADKGPDIWFIHNTWLPKHKDKIEEMPVDLMDLNVFRQSFVDVVEKDFIDSGKIYALPLSVDTLALIYNKDLLNSAGISSPPETWEDLVDDLDKLTKKDQWGNILTAGAAIGTAKNIHRSTDILSLLMLQNGTQMVSSDKGKVTIDERITLKGESYMPGYDALRFYTEFANPSKRVYTWNRQMHYSTDAFIEGKTAMIFDYAYELSGIKNRASYLNFGVAPMPQIKGREFDINYANYWALAVSKKSKSTKQAWEFIKYLTSKENSEIYLERTKRPTARKDLVDLQKSDQILGVFAKQSLTARTWYQADSSAIETIFADAIESVVLGEANLNSVIETAVRQINLLMEQ